MPLFCMQVKKLDVKLKMIIATDYMLVKIVKRLCGNHDYLGWEFRY